ncbi:amidohydrolase family protein [Streptomyces sp. ITFR-6]|uniref:amidohydrolase family protein n=1 Tax=Streptomyces sp. ITFR-6 TaxID=3075197 RepID=UPI0037DA18E2
MTDRAVTASAQLDDLGLELRRERTTRPRLLLPHALHDGHPPGAEPLISNVRQSGSSPPADAVSLSVLANDTAASAVNRYPTRFRALATLPTADPDAAAAELERAAALGFVGAMVYGRTGDVPLDDRRYDDLLAAAALRQPLFIHPQIPSAALRDAAYSGFDPRTGLALATFGWGWHLEAARSVLRLIASGVFDRHPDLQLVLGHWGELLLFWLDRADGLARVAGLERTVSEYVRSNVHIASSGMLDPTKLRHVLEVTTPDRLLLSTDFPFQRPTGAQIGKFLTAFPSDAAREAFMSGNARTLFRIDEALPSIPS